MDSPDFEAETHESKRRKVMEKRVVTVKIEGISEGRKKNEGPPSDSWSWRKYGQKPIKGSPHPRGYYRCSTSKGCSAKKQVERCKNDATMLIITYTSTHNHPTPDNIPSIKHLKYTTKSSPNEDLSATTPKDEQEEEEEEEEQQQQIGDGSEENENHFHYCQSPFSPSYDIMINHSQNPFEENTYGSLGVVFDEEPLGCPLPLINFSAIKSDEYDFYDELEELPHSSIFMRKDLFDERILVHPS